MYTEYVNNHDSSTTLLKFLNSSKVPKARQFQRFCKNCENHREAQGLSLQSFLIMPIQRIPRYELLLKELLQNTGENHYDHKHILEALELVKVTAIHINEAVRLSENRQFISHLQSRFHGNQFLVAPHRVFIREGSLLRKTRSIPKSFTFILFNDLLIYANEKFGRYILHQSIPIDKSFGISRIEVTISTPERERHG